MATIIFDFDDTIFDTQGFNNSFFKNVESLGVPIEVIKNTYEETKEKFGSYTFHNHIKTIDEIEGLSIENGKINELMNIDFSLYASDNNKSILNDLSKKNTLILLTHGEKDFQEFKINNSGLGSYFHEVHVVPGKKEDFLSGNNFTGDVYFINDKKTENDAIRKMFPHFKVIDFDIKKERSLSRLPRIS